jgi:plasmid maintenance system antidote protein VapI
VTTSKTVLPGQLILEQCIEAHSLSISEAAARANLTVEELEGLIAGQIRLTPSIAERMERHLGGCAEEWWDAQEALDLANGGLSPARLAVRGVEPWHWPEDWRGDATPEQIEAHERFLRELRKCPECMRRDDEAER